MIEIIYALPLWYAKIAAMIIFCSVVIFSWTLPYNFIIHGAPDTQRWRDIRIWATIVTVVQLFIYVIF